MTLKNTFKFQSISSSSRSRKNTPDALNFRSSLLKSYRQPFGGPVLDMATGRQFSSSLVVAAHIFQRVWQDSLPLVTQLKNIDDTCNGLLLYSPVEKAFDAAKLCIKVKSGGKMIFCLLDEDLRELELTEYARRLRDQAGKGEGLSKEEIGLGITFGELDGKELHFPVDVQMRPSRRLLNVHAVAAHMAGNNKIRDVDLEVSDDESARTLLSILKWRERTLPFNSVTRHSSSGFDEMSQVSQVTGPPDETAVDSVITHLSDNGR
jgi:hypothetical protein